MLVSSPSDLVCSETIDNTEDDPVAYCEQYTRDVFSYLRETEVGSHCRSLQSLPVPPLCVQVRCQPKVGYMLKQPDITSSMRSVLVDWLVEVVDEFTLQSRTLYLAVSLIDRFLSRMSVLRSKLQLVGSTAMYIAAKIEEIYPPELSDFAYITDNTYTPQQVGPLTPKPHAITHTHGDCVADSTYGAADAEGTGLPPPGPILHLLPRPLPPDCQQTVQRDQQSLHLHPAPGTGLLVCLIMNMHSHIHHILQYLCELALVNSDPFLKYLPSEIAASAVCLARHSLEQEAWVCHPRLQ